MPQQLELFDNELDRRLVEGDSESGLAGWVTLILLAAFYLLHHFGHHKLVTCSQPNQPVVCVSPR